MPRKTTPSALEDGASIEKLVTLTQGFLSALSCDAEVAPNEATRVVDALIRDKTSPWEVHRSERVYTIVHVSKTPSAKAGDTWRKDQSWQHLERQMRLAANRLGTDWVVIHQVPTSYASGLGDAVAAAVAFIEQTGELSYPEIGRLLGGVAPETVGAWKRQERRPKRESLERLFAVESLFQRVAGVMHPASVPAWIRRPIPLLEGVTVLDTLEAGQIDRIAAVIGGLESPVAT